MPVKHSTHCSEIDTPETYFPKWEPVQLPETITPHEIGAEVSTIYESADIVPSPLIALRDTVYGCLFGMLLGGVSGIFVGAAISLTIAESAWFNKVTISSSIGSSTKINAVMAVPDSRQMSQETDPTSRNIEPPKAESLL